MKHVAFFLSVVVAGLIISAGAYVYSSSATWGGHGAGQGLPEWFKQAVTFDDSGEVRTSRENAISPQNIKHSIFDLGDLYRGVDEDYFYPKLYASKGSASNQQTLGYEYVVEHALGRQAHQERHSVGTDSVSNSANRSRASGLSADRYYRTTSVSSGSGGSHGVAGVSRGSLGDSPGEGLPVIAQLLPLPGDVAELSPFIEEEKPAEEEPFSEPIVEKPIISDDEISQPVPEPATWLMVVAGLFLISLNRSRR